MASIETPENNLVEPNQVELESSATAPAAIEVRLHKSIIGSILLFILLAAIFGTRQFLLGVVIGGVLAYLNYRWLYTSLKAMISAVAAGARPLNAFQALPKFMFRWFMIFAVLGLSIWWGNTKITLGIMAGLLSTAVAVMFEAFVQVWYLLRVK